MALTVFEGHKASMTSSSLPLDRGELLVVEDNPKDARFIEEAFTAISADLVLHIVRTAREALDYIHGRGAYGAAADLDVIFLDWHLAQGTGAVVLEAAKSIDSAIPVVVLTGSTPHLELIEDATRDADLCIEKPTDPTEYVEVLGSLTSVNEATPPNRPFSVSQP